MFKFFNKFKFSKRTSLEEDINNLKKLKYQMENYSYTLDLLEDLYNTLLKRRIKPSERINVKRYVKVSFKSKTSLIALQAIENKYYYKETISRSDWLNEDGVIKPFSNWDSGDSHNDVFYNLLLESLKSEILLNKDIPLNELENNSVTEEMYEFINSGLYKLLLSDLLEMVIFYLENSDEIQ